MKISRRKPSFLCRMLMVFSRIYYGEKPNVQYLTKRERKMGWTIQEKRHTSPHNTW